MAQEVVFTGRQIGLIADKHDLYAICAYLQTKFSGLAFATFADEPAALSDIISNSIHSIQVFKDESMLPRKGDSKEESQYKWLNRVEISSYVEPSHDAEPPKVDVNGRIYVATSWIVGQEIANTDRDIIKIYDAAARYIKSHCHSKYRHNKAPHTCYCMPGAYEILTGAVQAGEVHPDYARDFAIFMERYQETVVNP